MYTSVVTFCARMTALDVVCLGSQLVCRIARCPRFITNAANDACLVLLEHKIIIVEYRMAR